MFCGYKIINNVLCLYIDDKYEFGDFKKDNNKDSIKNKIYDYIKKHKIKFNGTKVILLLSGLMIGSIILDNNYLNEKNYYKNNDIKYVISFKDIDNNNFKQEKLIDNYINTKQNNNLELYEENINNNINTNLNNNNINTNVNNNVINKENNESKNNEIYIDLKRENESIKIELNDYLIGVVASEMPASFNKEALKVQAIVSRTYTMKLIESKREITDNISTQMYKDNKELKNMWKNNYDLYYNKIKEAVYDTNNLKIKYQGKLIDAVYFSTSNGYTEDSYNVWNNSYDYLKSVSSVWDTSSSTFLRETNISFNEISNLLNIDFNNTQEIEILSRNNSNRIDKIRINNNIYTGVEIRKLLKLRSTDFDFEILDGYVKFTTRGYGHGVGLSQYGANGMANSGYNYEDIIKYYYTGVYIE